MKRTYYSLYSRLLDCSALLQAFAKVRHANGKPGRDGQTVEDFNRNKLAEVQALVNELRDKTYRPSPVRRASIPKLDGGTRILGIPTVRDRVVQQALLTIMVPIFDPSFHPLSYGYRPGRGSHKAVFKARGLIQQCRYQYVADMDLSQCFDRLNHELILSSIRRRITDGSILNLIRMFLTSGAMSHGCFVKTTEGSPQGGVISPLIANIYLDAFDQEMSRRGYRLIRYADDILILCQSRRSAEHAMEVASEILESGLRLVVNREKSQIATAVSGVKFLGFVIRRQRMQIETKRVKAFKVKVKALTRRNGPEDLDTMISNLSKFLAGWIHYFKWANCKSLMRKLHAWIRRRIRAKVIALWRAGQSTGVLQRLGTPPQSLLNDNVEIWRASRTPQANQAIGNRLLLRVGLFDFDRVRFGVPRVGVDAKLGIR